MSASTTTTAWWRNAVVYQIYPRSFADGNGDGIGDLWGLVDRLPVLAELGVDAAVADAVLPLAAGRRRLRRQRLPGRRPPPGHPGAVRRPRAAGCTSAGLRLIIDVVPNHTSDQHPWFQQALAAGPGSPERARYLFRDGTGPDRAQPPSDWLSHFGGSAWEPVGDGQWYLHLFSREQPDLNWDHPEVRESFHGDPAVLVGPRGRRLPRRRGPRPGQGHVRTPAQPAPPRLPTAAGRQRPALRPRGGPRDLPRLARRSSTSTTHPAWPWPRPGRPPASGPTSTPGPTSWGRSSTSRCSSRPGTGRATSRSSAVRWPTIDATPTDGGGLTWVLSSHDVPRHASRLAAGPGRRPRGLVPGRQREASRPRS